MNLRKKLCSAVLAAALVATTVLTGATVKQPVEVKAANSTAVFDDLGQNDMVDAMAAGWNLGNQLEAVINGTPGETNWGNPVITESLIKAVKNAGFSTIRVPVSYINYIGSDSNYTVNASWLNRVQEVVDMCINNDLFVIINMHGDGYTSIDGGWLLCGSSDQTTIKAKYKAVWKQIANKFKDYDEHLIFESMNEEFDGTWGTPNKTYYNNINDYNQIFVDTVRQTGGNNAKRWLLIPGWNTDITYTADDYGFALPSDNYCTASGKRIMISVHYYSPWEFCGNESNDVTQWGSKATNSSKVASWGDESFMKSQFNKMYTKFVQAGYPVVIGEYGSIDKTQADSTNAACRANYAERVCYYSKQWGMVPVIWDNGYNGNYGFGLFNRSSCTVTQQGIIDAIKTIYPTTTSTTTSPSPSPSQTVTTSPSPSPSPSASSTPSTSDVSVDYKVVSDWGSTFQGEIVITNNSNTTYNGWTLTCDYNCTITSLWGATLAGQSGTKVTIKNPDWSASLAPGASVTVCFIANGTDKSAPTNCVFS